MSGLQVRDGVERRPKRPKIRTVTLQDYCLSYFDDGRGAAIMFIHGLLGSSRHWEHLIDLEDRNRVLIPDLFGHGGSEKHMGDYSLGAHAATLRDLIDELGIERVTLLGHVLGGGMRSSSATSSPSASQP